MNKNQFLSGAAAAVVLYALDASAQFNYQNGDLLAGFGNGGSTDVIVDLGAISNFQQLSGPTLTWNLSSVLNATFGSVSSSIYWGAFGVNDQSIGYNGSVTQGDPNTIWATLGRSNPANQTRPPFIQGTSSSYALPLGDIQSIANVTSPGQAAAGLIVDYAPGVELVNTSVGNFTPMMSNPYNGNLQGDWNYNILVDGAGVADLYQNDPNAARAGYLGDFSLSSAGVLTFNPVPEPSSWVMLGGGMLALFALRRRQS